MDAYHLVAIEKDFSRRVILIKDQSARLPPYEFLYVSIRFMPVLVRMQLNNDVITTARFDVRMQPNGFTGFIPWEHGFAVDIHRIRFFYSSKHWRTYLPA
ncbi:hypothetical protein A4G21_16215 [Brucella intermedia]|nr:hypothetical protein A4G21_16215 [Brucella intermedia]OAE39688.1 hypothetical protein A7J42_14370 [Brucella intermedia]